MFYRGMDRPALDAAYNNTRAVADFPTIYAGFRARSAEFYGTDGWQRDIRYGEHPRERFDLLPGSGQNASTLLFIHGGYWQSLAKEDFAFVGQGAHAAGFNFVLAEYTLAPEFSMTQIVEEIGRLLDYVEAHRDSLGLGTGPVCLAGHSAGGHLGLMHRSHRLLAHVMAISPLVDLEPISLSWLNEKLGLTPSEIAAYSPMRQIRAGTGLTVAVGTDELPELVRHASEYAQAAAEANKAGEKVNYIALGTRNHFTVLEDLAATSGVLFDAVSKTMAKNNP